MEQELRRIAIAIDKNTKQKERIANSLERLVELFGDLDELIKVYQERV